MVLRTRRRDGATFWGCPRFPACRGTRAYDAVQSTRANEPAPASSALPSDDSRWRRAPAGASARATYERRLERHRERVRKRRPAILFMGATLVAIGIALLNVPNNWTFLGWPLIAIGILRTATALFETPANIRAYRIGSAGEGRAGALLDELETKGFRVFHDVKRPSGRDNIDHFVIGPPGVVVVETKNHSGQVRVRGRDLYVDGRRKTEFVSQVHRQTKSLAAALAVPDVTGIICVVDGHFPWFGSRRIDGIDLVSRRSLLKTIRAMPATLAPEDVDRLALIAARLRSA